MEQQWKLDLLNFKFQVIQVKQRVCIRNLLACQSGHDWTSPVDLSLSPSLPQDVFQNRIPEGAQWLMRFAYGVVAGGTDEEMLADKGQKVNLGQVYLASMCGEVFSSLGAMIGLVQNCAQMSGKLARVSEMLEVLDELDEQGGQLAGTAADEAWSYDWAELTTVGSGLNIKGSFGDPNAEVKQTGLKGDLPPTFISFGSQVIIVAHHPLSLFFVTHRYQLLTLGRILGRSVGQSWGAGWRPLQNSVLCHGWEVVAAAGQGQQRHRCCQWDGGGGAGQHLLQ